MSTRHSLWSGNTLYLCAIVLWSSFVPSACHSKDLSSLSDSTILSPDRLSGGYHVREDSSCCLQGTSKNIDLDVPKKKMANCCLPEQSGKRNIWYRPYFFLFCYNFWKRISVCIWLSKLKCEPKSTIAVYSSGKLFLSFWLLLNVDHSLHPGLPHFLQ